jgi:hypothetical protein
MKSSYSLSRSFGCRVPAPPVRFGVGVWMVIARQFPWGKGAIAGDETRRGRKTAPGVLIAVTDARASGVFHQQTLDIGRLTPGGLGELCPASDVQCLVSRHRGGTPCPR